MKIAVTETGRGRCLILDFIITRSSERGEMIREFNINNLADARFKFLTVITARKYFAVTYLSLKKNKSAMHSPVKVHVNSVTPKYSKLRVCTEDWSDYQETGRFEIESSISAISTVNLIAIKGKSVMVQNIFYEDVDFTDFTLTTADGSVPVHRACLIAHSAVFKAMLSQEWKETAEGRLNIDGITLQTLQHLKQFMYLGTLPDDGLRPLLLIAMYYLMDELKSECILKLAHTVTPEHLDGLLNFASENKVPELTFAILETTPRDVVNLACELREIVDINEL